MSALAERLAGALLALLVMLAAVAGAAWLVGYTPLVERSDSMSPALRTGDLLVTRQMAAEDARPGQIVTFRDEALGGRSVTHRVVRVTRHGDRLAFTTRGDANRSGEDWTISAQADVSRVVARIPHVGSAALWAMSPLVRFLLAGAGCALLSGAALRRLWSNRLMRRRNVHALAAALVLVSAAGALPLVTSSSFSDATVNNGSSISAVPDWTAPTVTAAAIAKTAGGSAGYVKRSGTYYVYAAATDSGAPASGIGSVRANVSTVTTGQTLVPLVAGNYSVGGVSYQYRSAQLTAKSTLATGPLAFSVTATDGAGGSTTADFSVTGDSTAPTASAVQATNVSGGTAGKPELGDTLTLTYSEPLDWASILAGWDGTTTTDVVLILTNGGSNSDYFQVYSPGLVLRPVGTIYLNRTDVLTGTSGSYVAFGLSGQGTPSRMTATGSALSFVLGTPTGSVGTASGSGTMTWTPSTTATDRAGNAMSSSSRTEAGTSDKDF